MKTKPAVRRILMQTLLAAVVVPILSAAVTQAAEPHQTLDQYKPKDEKAVIKAVSLGSSTTNRFDPAKVATQFDQGVQKIVVWYRWEGAPQRHRVNVRWYSGGAMVLEQGEPLNKPSGSEAWFLASTGEPLPAGDYRVEILENGKAVTTIPFRIGGAGVVMLDRYKPKAAGAVIKSVSLSASDSDDFDSKRVGTEFPEGVRRVVVYYVWEGAKPEHRVDARWSKDKSAVGEKGYTLTTATGFGVFSVGPLPAGNYRVDLLENGKPVTAIPFRVGPKPGR